MSPSSQLLWRLRLLPLAVTGAKNAECSICKPVGPVEKSGDFCTSRRDRRLRNHLPQRPGASWRGAIAPNTDQAHLAVFNANDIRQLLVGHLIAYSPPGWCDSSAHEEFHRDGMWKCVQYSRGPMRTSGQWSLAGDEIAVEPDSSERLAAGWNKRRSLWRNERTGDLLMRHVREHWPNLLAIKVRPLEMRPERSDLLKNLLTDTEQVREAVQRKAAAMATGAKHESK